MVETDGVMARYRDHHLDGTLIKGEWHEIKLGLVGDWQDGQLVNPSYVAARETASSFAPRLGTEAARRGALDIVGWRGLGTDGGGQEAVFRGRGLPIGSGAVEGGAKHLVQQRMKRPGMRWNELGARAILHLRCDTLNTASLPRIAS